MARRHEKSHALLHCSGKQIHRWDDVEFSDVPYTAHAREKLSTRSITDEQIRRVIDFGRETHQRHASVFFVGSKEIGQDPSLADCEGIHVVCSPNGTVVITAYRNKVFTERRYQSGQRPWKVPAKKRYGG